VHNVVEVSMDIQVLADLREFVVSEVASVQPELKVKKDVEETQENVDLEVILVLPDGV
jgi:hypothetical protein